MGKWPAAAAALASILTGAAVVVTRFVVETVPPLPLGWLRYSIAVLVLLIPLVLFAWRRPSVRTLVASLGLGALFFGVFTLCFNLGLQTVPSATAGTIVATMPALTLLLAAAVRIEALTWTKSLGVLMAVAGVALVLGASDTATSGLDDGNRNGQWWLVGAAVCGALYNVGARIWLSHWPAITTAFWSMSGGVCLLTLMSMVQSDWPSAQMLDADAIMAVLFLGTAAGALGFTLWIWALARATPTQVAVFFTLNPVSAALLGSIFLGEPVSAVVVAGMAIVLSGILLTAFLGRRASR